MAFVLSYLNLTNSEEYNETLISFLVLGMKHFTVPKLEMSHSLVRHLLPDLFVR